MIVQQNGTIGKDGRKVITANGTKGELKDAQPGDVVKVAWCDEKREIGRDGRLYLVKVEA